MRDTEVENWSRNSRMRRRSGTSIYITTSLHPPSHSSSIIVSVLCGSMEERSGLQYLLLSQYVSFQIYCQLFQACLTSSSIWPNHLVLDHSTGFFLLSFNSKTPYPCSTYSKRRKSCSRSSSNSINKLRILTLLKTSFLPAILLYFDVRSCTFVDRHKRLRATCYTHLHGTQVVSFATQNTDWAVRFQMLGLWIYTMPRLEHAVAQP